MTARARVKKFSKFLASQRAGVLLVLVLAAALLLRLYGIRWGLPDASHLFYSYHPDEALHLLAADWLAQGSLIPKHFMYGGTLHFAFLNAVARASEILPDVTHGYNILADQILLGRYILVAVALVTIVLVYHIGRLLFGTPVGILAALFVAIAPAHIAFAQVLRPDEMAAFLATLIVYLAVKIHRSGPNTLRYSVYAGLTLGAAMSLRLPLIIFAGAPVVALLLTSRGGTGIRKLSVLLDRRMLAMGLCIPLAYAVSSPQTFLHPDMFRAGLEVQWGYQSTPFPDTAEMGPGFYQYGWLMLHQALGYALYGLALAGVLYALRKRSVGDWLLLAAIIPYLILVSFTSWVVVRYTLPLVPLLAILAARFALLVLEQRPRLRALGIAAIAVVVGWTLMADAAYLKLQAGKNVRAVATEWIEQQIPPGSSIVVVKSYLEDDFFNPAIPKAYRHHAFYLLESGDGTQLFRGEKYDYLVLHEYLYKNMERLGDRHPLRQSRAFHASLISSRYRLVKEFKQPTQFLGVDFAASFSSNDYTIVNPGIRVYQYQ